MKKITKQASNTFWSGKKFNKNNTLILSDHKLYLHGNLIAEFNPAKNTLTLNSCRWHTPTTKERLNGILEPLQAKIFQKKYQWYITAGINTFDRTFNFSFLENKPIPLTFFNYGYLPCKKITKLQLWELFKTARYEPFKYHICEDCFIWLFGDLSTFYENPEKMEYFYEKFPKLYDAFCDKEKILRLECTGRYNEFSKEPCEICETKLAGKRYETVGLIY